MFRLRLIAAVAVMGALVWGMTIWAEMARNGGTMFGPWGTMLSEGGFLFERVQLTLTLIILALAPTLTADAIARERRESTLNLLGLTPLSPVGVVVGKCAANGLRALTLWLAAIPVVTIPFLLGGVSGRQMIESVVAQFAGLTLGLVAGLLGSSITVHFRRALALAFVIEVAVLLAAIVLYLCFWTGVAGLNRWLGTRLPIDAVIQVGWSESAFVNLPPSLTGSSRFNFAWTLNLVSQLLIVGVIGTLVVLFVARRVKKLWQEEPPRPETLELQRQLTQPILFPGWMRQRQRARLSRNPLLWIQHRTVAAALTRWGWISVVMVIWMMIATTGGWMGGFGSGFSMPMWMGPMLLLGGMAFSAAGGFRVERENGTLELLLVTPLTTGHLLQSRWLAHLREFVLPVGLQVCLAIYVQGLWRRAGVDFERFNWWLIMSLLTLPAIGLWRGLRARNFVTAVLSTMFWGLFVPTGATLMFSALNNPAYFGDPALLDSGGWRFFLETRLDWGVLPAVFQLMIGLLALMIARRELNLRQFAHMSVSR